MLVSYIAILLVSGFVVGLVARALLPGNQKMGCLSTSFLGITGSYVGGFLASVLTHQPTHTFHPVGFIGSVLGAMALMIVIGLLRKIF